MLLSSILKLYWEFNIQFKAGGKTAENEMGDIFRILKYVCIYKHMQFLCIITYINIFVVRMIGLGLVWSLQRRNAVLRFSNQGLLRNPLLKSKTLFSLSKSNNHSEPGCHCWFPVYYLQTWLIRVTKVSETYMVPEVLELTIQ